MKEAVWITGLGVVSAAGCGVAASLQTLRRGIRPAPAPRAFPAFAVPRPMFAAAGDYPADDRTFHLARAAAREALADAGLEALPAGFRLGVCLGTTVACQLNDPGGRARGESSVTTRPKQAPRAPSRPGRPSVRTAKSSCFGKISTRIGPCGVKP